MHREHTALWSEIVGDGENAFLHLAGVFRAEDDEFPVFEAEINARLGIDALGEAVSWELTSVIDCEIGLAKIRQLLPGGSDQHRPHEQRMIGA